MPSINQLCTKFQNLISAGGWLLEEIWYELCHWCFSWNFPKISEQLSVFSIWKSLQVLQKAHMKIVACAIFTYSFTSYTYTLLLCWKIKSCFNCCFPLWIRPQTTVQWYIWDYSSVRIGFNFINKCHRQPIVYTMLVKIC